MGSEGLLDLVTQESEYLHFGWRYCSVLLPVLEWIGGWGFDFPAYDLTLEEIATGTSFLYLTLCVAVVRTLYCSRSPK
jgi:hypothetical protein